MNKLWFKRKQYGWGWTPSSWEGWSMLGIYIGLIFSILKDIDMTSHSVSDTFITVSLPILGLTFVLLVICYIKGEPPRWTWGNT